MSKLYGLSEAQKSFYSSIGFGGSNGDITPSDDTEQYWIGLRVGIGGTLKVTMANGQVKNYQNIASGQYLPIAVRKVWATVDAGIIAGNITSDCAWDEEIMEAYKPEPL